MAWVHEFRPKQLSEVLGNPYMKEKLRRMLQAGSLPQALMFTGIQGIGKTSFARILASTLMCENVQDGERCLTCATCERLSTQFIGKGRSVQGVPIFEYDIAKFNKREDVAKIVERIQQRLLSNQKTIYILDEIQRATPEAQSCFLKVIEEPQPNVYVILCTTDKDKLIAPLRSRFHQIQLHRPTVEDLSQHLEQICQEKGLRYQRSALSLIAEKFNCVPREAINKLEFIGLSHDVTQQNVFKELQMPMDKHYYQFFDACFSGNFMQVIQLANQFQADEVMDVHEFILEMERFLLKLLNVRAGVGLEYLAQEDLKLLRKWSKRFHNKEFVMILGEVTRIKGQLAQASVDFALMQLALTITQCLNGEEIQAPTEQAIRQQYTEVTEELVTTQIQTELRSSREDVTPTQFMDIFGATTQIQTKEV